MLFSPDWFSAMAQCFGGCKYNEKEIIEAIAIILESKPTNNNALDVWLEVQDENLNVLCVGRDIIQYCNENRSTEKETQELVGEYIKGLIER